MAALPHDDGQRHQAAAPGDGAAPNGGVEGKGGESEAVITEEVRHSLSRAPVLLFSDRLASCFQEERWRPLIQQTAKLAEHLRDWSRHIISTHDLLTARASLMEHAKDLKARDLLLRQQALTLNARWNRIFAPPPQH